MKATHLVTTLGNTAAAAALGLGVGVLIGLSGAMTACSSAAKREAPPSAAGKSQVEPEEKHLIQYLQQNHHSYFDWPVDKARMTRGFLPNRKKPHLGLDLAAPKGTPVYAAHDGTIIYAGRDFRGYGRMVMIEGAQGWASVYAHFTKIQAREGQKVAKGDQIGTMGRSGHATGVHLHFELRKEKGPIDPLDYLPHGTRLAVQ